jgi:uracil-DNA glycosylase
MFKIALIGEAFGSEEAIAKIPFIGASGQELNRMLRDAGIERGHTYVTNVFNLQPPKNDVEFFFAPKTEGTSSVFKTPLKPSRYLKREYESEVARCLKEIEELRPNIAILLGNTACWAFLENPKISKIRGAVTTSKIFPWLKCLPTYHPAAVLRQYDLRHVTVLDLAKAKRESEFPEVRRRVRELWLDPTLKEIETFYHDYVLKTERLAFDIETNYGAQITCIGFAPSPDRAICIPFFDYRKASGSYWNPLDEELDAWEWVRKYMASPSEKVGQNALFDLQYLYQQYGITAENAGQDSMLCHHSLHPEAPKSLDFLGSVYSSERAWKSDRPKGKNAALKRND